MNTPTRVLIVDDDLINRMVLRALLKEDGYQTLEAENGEQAVEVSTNQEVDIILLDIMMPVMDGYEAAKIIKETISRFIPIIFLTAVTEDAALVWDRGEIRPGAAADLVLIDRSRLAVGPARILRDFPTGAARMVWEQRGYVATIVNGQVIIDDGAPTGATPGDVLRFNQ